MKFIIHLLASIGVCFGLIQLQSCGDPSSHCKDPQTYHHNISASDLSKVPYTGFDTLYFIGKAGDTCIVRGTGKKFSSEEKRESSDPGCPTERIDVNQLYTINFIPIKGNLEFQLSQKQSDYNVTVDRSTYNVIFRFESRGIDREENNEDYIDSLIIKNKVYTRISVFLTAVKPIGSVRDTTNRLLYNKSYGILYIKSTKQNEEYCLIPKP
ncbi:MAG: hypothetical protein V4590_10405 [Bacteroidota bacterium]